MQKNYDFLNLNRTLPIVFFAALLAIFYLVFFVYQPYLLAFFIALIFYVIFRKIYEPVLKYCGDRKTLASTIMTLIVILVVILPLAYILVSLFEEMLTAIESIKKQATPENIKYLTDKFIWLKNILNLNDKSLEEIQHKLLNNLQDLTLPILKQGGTILMGFFEMISNFTLSMIILFFFFRNGREIPNMIYRNLPFPDELEERLGKRLSEVLDAVIKGNLLIAIAQGFMIGFYFFIFDLPTPILYGSLASFFALIPIVGTMIVWLPGSIYLYLSNSTGAAIALGALAFPTYFLLENFIKPWLLDRKLNLHPLFLFLAIIGGLSQFGIKGLILGPLIVTGFVSIWQIISVWNSKNESLS